MNFETFALAVEKQFAEMSKQELFVVGNDNRALEKIYLANFPEGTDPIFKVNTEHTCSCCFNFLRNIGNTVALDGDGKMITVWDGYKKFPHPYDTVAKAMRDFLLMQPITNLFRTKFSSFGQGRTRVMMDGSVHSWTHFYARVDNRHRSNKPDEACGTYRTSVQVLQRAFDEVTLSALDDVLDLISNNAIYRGAEFKETVQQFRNAFVLYQKKKDSKLAWALAGNMGISRFHNSVIGELVKSISKGTELSEAVRAYEQMVAPTNYKRPTALITPSMVAQAVQTIKDLDLEGDLERRLAKISDVSVNDVLWVDNAVRSKMKGGIEDLLMGAVKATSAPANTVEIEIEEFMKLLPTISSMEVFVANQLQPNFVSVTAPVHIQNPRLFKWNNDYAWSYTGNITDSIKEKVKRAGGNVTSAKLRVSLAWFNFDDLDIHVYEPNGNRIYFANKSNKLDVDMNAGGGRTRQPVENVSWVQVMDGDYNVLVNNYCQRERSDMGCVIEVENNGVITQLSYNQSVGSQVPMVNFTVKNGVIIKMTPSKGVIGGTISQEKWGIPTEKYAPVDTVMFSPNYWGDNAVGNKHYFFILKGCKTDEPLRGMYNEFLSLGLEKHRKVFEVLGDRTKCQPADEQLSGVGFSSTKGDSVVVKATVKNRQCVYKINF